LFDSVFALQECKAGSEVQQIKAGTLVPGTAGGSGQGRIRLDGSNQIRKTY